MERMTLLYIVVVGEKLDTAQKRRPPIHIDKRFFLAPPNRVLAPAAQIIATTFIAILVNLLSF